MINRRVLAIILAITMATSASVSSGFDVFASEVPAAQEELTETEENILETVDEILDKKDEAEESSDNEDLESGELSESTDSQTEEEADEIVIVTEGTDVKKADIKLTASAEDGTVVTVKASADEFPYENLSLVVNVVTGTEAENASEEIDAENPAENTAKRVTYDVQVRSNGEEVQPVYGRDVKVSFSVPDAPSGADAVTVYHHDENEDQPVEIASAELSGDSETAVVGTAAGSESGIEDAETEVIICNTDAGNTSAVTSSDSNDDENYEDYELIDDVTVSGETTSFSYYTVDFTYNEKRVSIDGDTDHNELSNVLANIGITDAITDAAAYMDAECTEPAANNTVTVDGKDLFRIYEEGGTWYVDAINAFTSEHGLWVKAGDAEYKIKVTDASYLIYTVHDAEGIDLRDDDTMGWYAEGDILIYSDVNEKPEVSICEELPYKLRVKYRTSKGYPQEVINAYGESGYYFKEWKIDEKSAEPLVERVQSTFTVKIGEDYSRSDPEGCLVVTQGKTTQVVEVGETASITAPKGAQIHFNGDTMTIDGWDGNVKASASEWREISYWETNTYGTTVYDGMRVEAYFGDKTASYTFTATSSVPGIPIINSPVTAPRNSLIGGDPGWGKITVGSVTIEAPMTAPSPYEHYRFEKFSDFEYGYLRSDVTVTAYYVNYYERVNATALKSPFGGHYETSSASEVATDIVEMGTYDIMDVTGDRIQSRFSVEYIQAVADPGFEFVKWVDENGQDLPEEFYATEDFSVMAIYKNTEEQHIHIGADEGGSVVFKYGSAKDYEFSINSAAGAVFKVDPNNKARLIMTYADANKQKVEAYYDAVPNTGYDLADGDVWTGLPNGNVFTDAELTAHFKEKPGVVTFAADNGGKVYEAITTLTDVTGATRNTLYGSHITEYGSRISIGGIDAVYVASPASAGYVFDKWIISTGGNTVTDNTTITATFVEKQAKTVTPIVEGGTGGMIFPPISVQIAEGSAINATTSDACVEIGKEKFVAAADEDYYFSGWTFEEEGGTPGTVPPASLEKNLTIYAKFIPASSLASPSYVTIATPTSGGSYEKSFLGDTLTVPGDGTATVESKKDGNDGWLIFGNGRAYAHAIADSNYIFNSWIDADTGREFTGTTITDDMTLQATFLYQGDYPDPWVKPASDVPTGGGSGVSSTPDPLDKTNYHAENTYGSWESPINDGVWEYLSNDSWAYNSGTSMKNCWACIVNPYANVDKGQHAHDWFFFDPYGHMMTGWRMIDGKWYYFEPISNGCRGGLYMSTTTPDGYQVDANGAWIQ